MSGKAWLLAGVSLGLLAVVLGAFGAHGLENAMQSSDLSAEEVAHRLDNWEVGARYQMYHALALLVLGALAVRHPSTTWSIAGSAFLLGVVVFSGCLYLNVLTGVKTFGMIVPIGGVSLIVGWATMGLAVLRSPL